MKFSVWSPDDYEKAKSRDLSGDLIDPTPQ